MTPFVRLVSVVVLVGALEACGSGKVPAPVHATADPLPVVTTSATSAVSTDSPTPSAQPVVEQRTVTETVEIPFAEQTMQDSTLAKGTTKVRTQGVAGVKTLTYQVTVWGAITQPSP